LVSVLQRNRNTRRCIILFGNRLVLKNWFTQWWRLNKVQNLMGQSGRLKTQGRVAGLVQKQSAVEPGRSNAAGKSEVTC
jgi:hypothetical protein